MAPRLICKGRPKEEVMWPQHLVEANISHAVSIEHLRAGSHEDQILAELARGPRSLAWFEETPPGRSMNALGARIAIQRLVDKGKIQFNDKLDLELV